MYTLTISLDDLEDKICENFKIEIEANKRIRITSSSLEKYQYLEIMPANFDKSKALKFLVNKWHLKLKNCMAIGDSLNDYEMLQKAGLGIMMKNGYSDLIKVATDMCDSNNKNGVGKAILKYILK
ncbi:HAD-IIB family hydrolase [Spiroplasma endosymbiont of Lonchoptera lutea]|uniref:HAD family hydrolase n=1 Tax=Spiroplasma endosymbiont of Lonchoptera lutea TaxID=3066297 RepID=UPI0030D504F9